MKPLYAILLCSAVLAQEAAAQNQRPTGPLKVQRATRGDTTVVRTLSGSTWGDRVSLVEELRIGTRDGDGPDSFGFLTAGVVLRDGVLAVFDQSVPALRLFDSSGKHLRTLGRDGAGPGEYRNQSLGLAVDRNGVLLMYDPLNTRLNRWSQDGTVLPSWQVPAGYYGQYSLLVDTAGNTYIRIITERPQPGKEMQLGFARLSPDGELRDTIRQPAIHGSVGTSFFSPQKYWFVNRAGETVMAFSGAYVITIAAPGRRAIQIGRRLGQVALLPAERANYQAVSDAINRNPMVRQTGKPSSVPAVKPYFSDVLSDLDGRIWVRLHTQGEEYVPPPRRPQPGAAVTPQIRWRGRVVWDVFQRDGTYLGQVELPFRTNFVDARGNQLWATQRGEDDEQYVVRYRIVPGR